MKHYGCGFATDEDSTKVGYDDLLLALVICSMTYQDFLDFINNRKNGKQVMLWYAPWKPNYDYFYNTLRKEGRKLKARIQRENLDMDGLKAKMKLFMAYLKEGTKVPKYWESEDGGKESGAHWSQSVFTAAISELGYTRAEALNTPLRQVFNDFFKYAESQGGLELMKAEEEQLIGEE